LRSHWSTFHTRGASGAFATFQEIIMREEQLYTLLSQLISQGASLEEQTHAGRRFILRHAGQRLTVPGAVALKLMREGRVREACKVGDRTLWFGV
jgi:hypothetical protein